MLRVVLDTNVLIAAISERSTHHWVWLAFMKGEYELCLTTDILTEYAEIIGRCYSPVIAEFALTNIMLHRNLVQIVRYYEWNAITADLDDNKFFDCAVAANAHYLVTEDKHFNVLKHLPFPSVRAVKMYEFWQLLYGDSPFQA